MKTKEIYIPKNQEPKEIYRNLITIYYFLLFNKKSENYYKKFLKFFYEDKAKNYYDFFNNNFYQKQNILFFTLYNQLPLEFLPLPNKTFYLNFPLITFFNNHKIKLSNKFISKKLIEMDIIWSSNDERILNNVYNLKKEENENKLDNYNFNFNINKIFNLSEDFFIDKILFIFTNNPIICNNYKINYKTKDITLINYYIKLNSENYIKSNIKNKIINKFYIKYLCIYKKIIKNDIEDVFRYKTIKKDTYLYNTIKKDVYNDIYIHKIKEEKIPNFYTLTPFNKVLDPLYQKNNKYVFSEYIINNNIKTLDITTNTYFNNELFNNQNINLIDCFDINSLKNNNKYCNYKFINPEKQIKFINYNKKESLLLIIWKNKNIVDNSISFTFFLELLNIYSYFNLFDLVKKTNNEIKLLSEEIYIDDILKINITKNRNYVDDISKFKIYDQKEKYKQLYFKP